VVELGPDEKEIPSGNRETSSVFRLNRILVPVDFSNCSKKALEYAVPLAKQFSAEVTLLHVVQPDAATCEMPSLQVQTIQEAAKALDTVRESIGGTVHSNAAVRTGIPHLEIVEAAKELNVDLIILSTHGRTGLAHVVLGSTAERVVRRAGCPVLVVREREHDFVRVTLPATEAEQSCN
jgi:nucleotide-binding universal stress UspA family protein